MMYFFKLRMVLLMFILYSSAIRCIVIEAVGLCDFEEMVALRRNNSCEEGGRSAEPKQNITFRPSTATSCPRNMLFMNCTCQATCQDPGASTGCHSNCIKEETCICPEGFYLEGDECVPPEECGCFHEHGGFIQEGTISLVINCTKQCSCSNDELLCIDYNCGANATCKDRNGSLRCYCDEGLKWNGVECTTFFDCKEVYDAGLLGEGVYTICPLQWPGVPFQVYCKNGWTVFQRRTDGNMNFYRNWIDYKEGFGNLENEMWLGNEKLFYLTNQTANQLNITLVMDTTFHWLFYDLFTIGDEKTNYVLHGLGSYNGTMDFDYMTFHKNQEFTTKDRDNDADGGQNCAVRHYGGWWHRNCYNIHLNGAFEGIYDFGICLIKRGLPLKGECNILFTEMSIKPI